MRIFSERDVIIALNEYIVDNPDMCKEDIIYPILTKIDEKIGEHIKNATLIVKELEAFNDKKTTYKEIKKDILNGLIPNRDATIYAIYRCVDDSNRELYKDIMFVYHSRKDEVQHRFNRETNYIAEYTNIKNKILKNIRKGGI